MGDNEGGIEKYTEDDESVAEKEDESGGKAESQTERNEEELDGSKGDETEAETTDEEWPGPYHIWKEHMEDMGREQAN